MPATRGRSPARHGLPLGIWLDSLLSRAPGGQSIFRLAVAAVLGVASGYGAILFRYLIMGVSRIAFPQGGALQQLEGLSWPWVVLPPALGGLVVGPLVYFGAREAQGHGVPEVKDACNNRGGRIRPRVAVVKTLASGICIGSGGSVGREGPIVQIGASLGSATGQALGLRGQHLVDMVAGGAAAGIAATFNAPIAGVLFALEVILGRSSPRHFGPLIVSTVMATIVAHHYLGDMPAFRIPPWTLVSAWELPLYVLLGGFAAVVGVAFTRGLYLVEDIWEALPLPRYLHAVLGGAVVGLIGLRFPEVFGVGYEHIERVLGSGQHELALSTAVGAGALLLTIPVKIIATGTTIGSGGSGGIFAPSLFLGASLGGVFGGLANRWMPAGLVANPGAYALVAMGAVVAATTHAPLTAMIIVFELTNRHTIILPLMLACILSTVAAMWLCQDSIYTLKLLRRGVLSRGPRVAIITHVRTLLRHHLATVRPDAPLIAAVDSAVHQDQSTIYVTNRKKKLLGVVTLDDVAAHLHDEERERRRLTARDVMHAPLGTLDPEDTIDTSLDLFRRQPFYEVPVVDRRGRLVGALSRADVLSYYSREILRQDAVLSFVDEDEEGEAEDRHSQEVLKLHTDEVKAQIPVTAVLAGKSLRELNLRARFGVAVYAIRQPGGESNVPDPDAALVEGTTLVVVGPEAEVDHLKQIALESPSGRG